MPNRAIACVARNGVNSPVLEADFTQCDKYVPGPIAFSRADAVSCATRRAKWGVAFGATARNALRNSKLVGAVVGAIGSGGALPTNFYFEGAFNTLPTREIVELGMLTLDGQTVPYMDVRLAGITTNTYGNITFEQSNIVSAAPGQQWTHVVYLAMVGGSTANLTGGGVTNTVHERTAAAVYVGSASSLLVPTAVMTRHSAQRAMGATAGRVSCGITLNFANGANIDITLRIAGPQLQQGAVAPLVQTAPDAYSTSLEVIPAGQPLLEYSADTLAGRGLRMEPAEQNLVANSRTAFAVSYNPQGVARTANYATAPDGTVSVTRFVTTVAGAQTFNLVPDTVTADVSGTPYGHSFWWRPVVNFPANQSLNIYAGDATSTGGLQFTATLVNGVMTALNNGGFIENFPDGWQRITLPYTATANNGAPSLTFGFFSGTLLGCEFHMWQRQRISGRPWRVSDIFTNASAQTRQAADAVISSLAAIGCTPAGWSGYFEWEQGQLGIAGRYGQVFELSDGPAANNRAFLYQGLGGTFNVKVRNAGVDILDQQVGTVASGGVAKVALALLPNRIVVSVAGAAPVRINVTVPLAAVDRLHLCKGMNNTSSLYLDGWLRKFKAWAYFMPDAQLSATSA